MPTASRRTSGLESATATFMLSAMSGVFSACRARSAATNPWRRIPAQLRRQQRPASVSESSADSANAIFTTGLVLASADINEDGARNAVATSRLAKIDSVDAIERRWRSRRPAKPRPRRASAQACSHPPQTATRVTPQTIRP
jgi:hypothetical protein